MTTSPFFSLRVQQSLLYLYLSLIGLAAFVYEARVDQDLWGHLAFGRDTVLTGAVTGHDPYSYLPTRPWVNHEWLCEVFYYLLLRWGELLHLGGARTLLAFKGLAGAVLAVAAGRCALLRGATPLSVAAWATLALAGVAPNVHMRPYVFTYLLLPVVLCLLEEVRRGKRGASAILPVLIGVWTNCHASFVVGLGVIALYLGEALVRRRFEQGRMLTWALGGSLLATLVNPYGWRYWPFVLEAVSMARPYITEWRPLPWVMPGQHGGLRAVLACTWFWQFKVLALACLVMLTLRLDRAADRLLGKPGNTTAAETHEVSSSQVGQGLGPHIGEGLAPHQGEGPGPYKRVCLGPTAEDTAFLAPAAVLLITAWMANSHYRHVPLFLVASTALGPALVQSFLPRPRGPGSEEEEPPSGDTGTASPQASPEPFPRAETKKPTLQGHQATPSRWARPAGLALGLGLALYAGLQLPATLQGLGQGLTISVRGQECSFPLGAVEFMRLNHLQGKTLVFFDWGELLIWEFGRSCPISFDGRLETVYARHEIDTNLAFTWGRDLSPERDHCNARRLELLQSYPPDLALVTSTPASYLHKQADWLEVWHEGQAFLFVRRSAATANKTWLRPHNYPDTISLDAWLARPR